MNYYPNPHAPMCPWYEITEYVGAPNIKWCEETICSWISEPANTWSNLGYILIGIFILWDTLRKKSNYNLKQFGPIIIFMGLMSYVYHASNFYGSQILDFIGMFLFVGWVIGANLIRIGKLRKKWLLYFNISYTVILTIVLHYMYLYKLKFQVLILISAIFIIFLEVLAQNKDRTEIKWFITSLIILAIAFAFSISDVEKIWCNPSLHGWFQQGHALWHWIASLAMWATYKHQSQEKLRQKF